VATAAEAFAAAQFARCGWDVAVQYGANQPEYDFVASNGDWMMKVSAKGSKDGGWGITQSFIKNARYKKAADDWLARHGKKTVLCFVQFKDTTIDTLPRMYLATPKEVADWLKKAAGGRGDTILYEEHHWSSRARAAGVRDAIPGKWRFSAKRIWEMAQAVEGLKSRPGSRQA
jgi:hypothetical protein